MKINIKPEGYIGVALAIFILPFSWIIAWLCAAFVHEVCHILAVKACGGKVYSLTMCYGGMEIQIEQMERKKEFLCYLSGPIGGLLLVLFAKLFPRLALCAMLQSLYNLIPICPMDGGRAMQVVITELFPKKGVLINDIVQSAILITIIVFALLLALKYTIGLLPIIIALTIVIRFVRIKFPCKQRQQGVQ